MEKLKVILIGAGNRGTRYTDEMQNRSDKFEVVAVAEPIESRRDHIKNKHNIPEEMCFNDWKELLKLGKIADIAVVSTMDKEHFEPAMAAINLKYNLLLEKPIAPTAEECKNLSDAAKLNGVKVVVCTVLRYTPLFIRIKEMLDNGKIGDVVSINHEENVGNVHYSHSYTRGNWGNEERSANMLLAKSCHDIDLLQWLLGKKCVNVHSFGSLSHFTRTNAPDKTPDYCIEGCRLGDTCPYNAVKLYLDDKDNEWFRTTSTRLANPTDDDVKKAITETQYGKCVYKCDNDVVDHQVVNMLFEDNITVSFTMTAFNKGGRAMHIMGTKGEIHAVLGDDNDTYIKIYDFETKTEQNIELTGSDGVTGGHGGGDGGIVETLYDYLLGEYSGKSVPDIEISCYNHLLVFAAEKARLENRVIEIQEYISNL
ncbi:MAG: Gfo/Idh/MocA family oxidoreductase [Clostridia bacterium]|nr:Gfo/Idh/MocA family oxidoreductase [Clostridia bacterium]